MGAQLLVPSGPSPSPPPSGELLLPPHPNARTITIHERRTGRFGTASGLGLSIENWHDDAHEAARVTCCCLTRGRRLREAALVSRQEYGRTADAKDRRRACRQPRGARRASRKIRRGARFSAEGLRPAEA